MSAPKVTVVTPWLDAVELIGGWWKAMRAGFREGDAAIIIDNGSDPSIERAFHDRVPDAVEWVTFVRFERNIGFSRACNVGLDRVATEAVAFINNDIRMIGGSWLQTIRDALRPGALVGAQMRRDDHSNVDGAAVPYLDGWCLAGMYDDLIALGGWNEEFEEPAYYGDNELCIRARAAGLELGEVPVELRHLANYTSRRMDVSGVSARNRERYIAAARELLAQTAAV